MHPQPPPEKPWGIGRATGKLNRESQERSETKRKRKRKTNRKWERRVRWEQRRETNAHKCHHATVTKSTTTVHHWSLLNLCENSKILYYS
jgi:hypothetical protein